jgi:dihydropteroate synthase
MGVINVTPDSFSDGGDFAEASHAIDHARAMLSAGADIVDVGGESTRPGAQPVPPEEEAARVLPVVRALAHAGAVVSIDTRHAAVMGQAVEAGAWIINDVTALTGDPDSARIAAKSGAAIVLMHMLGEPQTMQADPRYADVTCDLLDYFAQRMAALEQLGLDRARIAVDPGIGFGKTVQHNLQLLDELAAFHVFGCPILLGASRKSFIGRLSKDEKPKQRVAGTLAAHQMGFDRGVQVVRVHDVAEAFQARAIWTAAH